MVINNLRHALPEISEKERKKIASKFYRNFIDNWIETIKLISISRKSLHKRISGNFEIFNRLHASGKSAQLSLGHIFNWEMMGLHIGVNYHYTLLSVYMPQRSKISDRLMKYIRGRWGNYLIPSSEMVKSILPWRKKQYLLGLIADQSTPLVENKYWLYFLNRPTGFAKGTVKFARSQNIPVVMPIVTKPKRGHYHFDFFLLTDDPKSLSEGEMIRMYVKRLEENIRLQPDIYLWSHKRWKREWKAEYENLWMDNIPSPTQSENIKEEI